MLKNTPVHNIDDLLVKYILREVSIPERQVVDDWLQEKTENRKYFDHFRLIWEESSRLEPAVTVDEEEAWIRFVDRKKESNEGRLVSIKKSRRLPGMVAAAIFIGIIVFAAALFIYQSRETRSIAVYSGRETKVDSLSDGSIVTLNKNSSVSYDKSFKGDKRSVSLVGEAFFNVAPNKHKPFIITVNDVTIHVVGTSFNVKSINGNTEVIVESGIVKVEHLSKTIDLRPKEKIMINARSDALVKDSIDSKLYNYYRTKLFVCDNTPLWQLVEKLNEAYNTNIVIDNKPVSNLPLTTTFNETSLDTILSIVTKTLNIKAEQKDNKIILR